jgi:hypothetical protein
MRLDSLLLRLQMGILYQPQMIDECVALRREKQCTWKSIYPCVTLSIRNPTYNTMGQIPDPRHVKVWTNSLAYGKLNIQKVLGSVLTVSTNL